MQMHEMQLDHDLDIAPIGKVIFNWQNSFNRPIWQNILIAPFGT